MGLSVREGVCDTLGLDILVCIAIGVGSLMQLIVCIDWMVLLLDLGTEEMDDMNLVFGFRDLLLMRYND